MNNGQQGVGYSDLLAAGISNIDFAGQTTERQATTLAATRR